MEIFINQIDGEIFYSIKDSPSSRIVELKLATHNNLWYFCASLITRKHIKSYNISKQ